MKVWGLWATLGFAILAFGLGQALSVAALAAFKSFDPLRVEYDGSAIALVELSRRHSASGVRLKLPCSSAKMPMLARARKTR